MADRILAIGDTGAEFINKFNRLSHVYNVESYGAVHDNNTDDTEAIQDTINACAAAGGGIVYFPNGTYLIGGALQTNVGGINYNSQLYIPDTNTWDTRYCLELRGESPILNSYGHNAVGSETHFPTNAGVVLRSTIAGSGTNPSVLCSKATNILFDPINYSMVELKNIAILVNPFIATTGPSMSGINFLLQGAFKIDNICCGLDLVDYSDAIEPDNHVFGFAGGYPNGDFSRIGKLVCSGFYYGCVLSEGVISEFLYMSCNKIGLASMRGYYGATAKYYMSLWNAYVIGTPQETIANIDAGHSTLTINQLNCEIHGTNPLWVTHIDFALDDTNLIYGTASYICSGGSVGENIVKTGGGFNFLIRNAYTNSNYHWTTATRPTTLTKGLTGYNTTTDKLECYNGSWNDLY